MTTCNSKTYIKILKRASSARLVSMMDKSQCAVRRAYIMLALIRRHGMEQASYLFSLSRDMIRTALHIIRALVSA